MGDPTMQYRRLGRSGLQVSVLSLGSWVTFGGQVDLNATMECMRAAFDAGINFFDTAEVYADGKSELLMGQVIKQCGWKRADLVISTKLFWGGQGPNQSGLSRKHIIEGLRASLDRLQLDYVDLVYAHRPDPDTPMEETVRAFNWCIEKGWAFYWGTSEWSAEEITDAHAVAQRLGLIGPLMEQPQYNMFHRERFEREYAPLYKKHGMGTTIWSPLASGVLTGKYNAGTIPADSRLAITTNTIMVRQRQHLETDEGKAKLAKVDKLMEIAKRLECTVAQLSLAWCLKNPNVSSVITGASRPDQVRENVKSLEVLSKLDDAVMEEIDTILDNRPAKEMTFR